MTWARSFLAFTLVGLLFTSQVWVDYAYAGNRIGWLRATAVALADWYAWALIAPLILRLAGRFRFGRGRWVVPLAVHLPLSLLCTILTVIGGGLTARAITGAARMPFSFLTIHVHFLTYWALVAAGYAIEQYKRARERELHASQLETQLAQAQLQALRMKLHPHFLFNTLNAIAALMREDVEAADLMIAKLSDLLRIALDAADVQELPLRRELELLELYLEIEQARAGPRLRVTVAPDPNTLDLLVPTLLLQPLLENAIRHGAYARPGPARVELRARVESGRLLIEVRDDGPGPPPVVTKGHGLENTIARLRTLYGGQASLELTRQPGGGGLVVLTLPLRRSPEDRTHWLGA